MTSSDPPIKNRKGARLYQAEGDEPTLRGEESFDEVERGLVIIVLPSRENDAAAPEAE